jgi:phage/plasmid-like protein (TIGR03299 family)
MNFADLVASAPRITLDGRPVVVSENHDMSSINWVAGLSDPGEMIACGAYQELRRLTGENDGDYAKRLVPLIASLPPEHRERITRAGIESATKRAGLSMTNGRVAVMTSGNISPWHALGTHFSGPVSGDMVLVPSGTNFDVAKRELAYEFQGKTIASKCAWSIVRTDTGLELGSVGSKYKVVQNREVVALADSIVGEFGARFETAGALDDGARVWYQIALPKQSFALFGGKVRNEASALFSSSHDGSGALLVVPTSENVVCKNTHRIALNKARGKGIAIRHTGDPRAKIEECRKALGLVVKGAEVYAQTADALSRARLGNERVYFGSILDEVLTATEAQLATGREVWARSDSDALAGIIGSEQSKYLEKRREEFDGLVELRTTLLDDMLNRFNSENCGAGGMRGSAFSGYMAVTESADHGLLGGRRQGSERKREETRFDSVTVGKADDIKQIAFRNAKTLSA